MGSNNSSDFVQLNSANDQKQVLGKISLWMYIWVTFRSYLLQSGFNYANFQGLGYSNVLFPALKKIYHNNKEALKQSVLSNIEFFNSNPQTLPLITSIHLTLLANGQSVDDARTIKMSLMGPLSGIGDSLSQFAIYPLFAVIAIGFAQTGDLLGPIFFLVGINVVMVTLRVTLGILGYKLGEAAISKLSGIMQTVIRISSMVGIVIIVALAVRITKVTFDLEYSQVIQTASGVGTKVVSLQGILDNIMPYLAPALWLIFIYLMITKKGWTAYRVIVVTIIVGVTTGVFGILAA